MDNTKIRQNLAYCYAASGNYYPYSYSLDGMSVVRDQRLLRIRKQAGDWDSHFPEIVLSYHGQSFLLASWVTGI